MSCDAFMTFMLATELPEEFMWVFKLLVKMVSSHGGKAGYYPEGFSIHFKMKLTKACMPDTMAVGVNPNDAERCRVVAMKSLWEEYLACLFIHVADNGRYQASSKWHQDKVNR